MIKRGETTRPLTFLYEQLSRLGGLSELNRPLALGTGMGTPVTGANDATGGPPAWANAWAEQKNSVGRSAPMAGMGFMQETRACARVPLHQFFKSRLVTIRTTAAAFTVHSSTFDAMNTRVGVTILGSNCDILVQ